MNKVILMGRLARAPDVRTTQSGLAVARFTLAIDRPKKKDGAQAADFPGIVAWDKTADFAGRYLSKGQRVLVEGRLQTGSYEKDGKKVYTTDVVAERIEFADGKREGSGGGVIPPGEAQGEYATEEDIPF